MKLGIDISTYIEELEHGAKYYDGDKEVDPVVLFHENGVDYARIRLWIDPKSESGAPYLAGNCDLKNFIRLAKMMTLKGYRIMLDIHYSDFWCDPGKQTIPKSWRGLGLAGLIQKVYTYTKETLSAIREQRIDIAYIQVGNEITNGILWPVGQLTGGEHGVRDGYENLVALLKSGINACREEYPKAAIVLHLERSHDQALYDEFFSQMEKFRVDYDVIGYSYYPYWHGTFDMFFANVEMCKKFKKRQLVAELGYAFTLEDYIKSEHGGAQLVVSTDNVETFGFTKEYPITPEGQKHFTEDFLRLSKEHGIESVFWWEPLWIPGEGICWASEAGMEYTGDAKKYEEEGRTKSTRNEWANQCLFDYEGRKLPAFDAYRAQEARKI